MICQRIIMDWGQPVTVYLWNALWPFVVHSFTAIHCNNSGWSATLCNWAGVGRTAGGCCVVRRDEGGTDGVKGRQNVREPSLWASTLVTLVIQFWPRISIWGISGMLKQAFTRAFTFFLHLFNLKPITEILAAMKFTKSQNKYAPFSQCSLYKHDC